MKSMTDKWHSKKKNCVNIWAEIFLLRLLSSFRVRNNMPHPKIISVSKDMEEKNCKFPFSIQICVLFLKKKHNDSNENISFQYFLLLLIIFMILLTLAWWLLRGCHHHNSFVIKNANFTFIWWFFKYNVGNKNKDEEEITKS